MTASVSKPADTTSGVRPKVILYNPQAVFFTFPLAFYLLIR